MHIIAFSGTHGTGKTTSAAREFIDLKFSHPQKNIGLLIDLERDCPHPINKDGDEVTQVWLFNNQVKKERDLLNRCDMVVTDRTIVDVIGYTFALKMNGLALRMIDWAVLHMPVYERITVKQARFNQFCFADGQREAKDMTFRRNVEDCILFAYEQLADATGATILYK